MSGSERFVEELHSELAAASTRLHGTPSRPRRRNRVLALAAAAAVVVLASVAALLTLSVDDVDAGVEVIRQGDELLIRLTDVETRPHEIEAAAQEAGIEIRVIEVPVGPGNVGRFVGSSGEGIVDEMRVIDRDVTTTFTGFRIPVDFDGHLELLLGRAPRPAEGWTVASSSTSDGEPLACETVFERPLGEVRDLIEARNLTDVRYFVFTPDGHRELAADDVEAYVAATVLRVLNTDADTLLVDAATSLDLLPPQSPAPSHGCDDAPHGD